MTFIFISNVRNYHGFMSAAVRDSEVRCKAGPTHFSRMMMQSAGGTRTKMLCDLP